MVVARILSGEWSVRDPQPQVAPTFPREVGLAASSSEEWREARCAASGKEK